VHASILLVLDEGLEVGTLEIRKITLAGPLVKGKEVPDGGEGVVEGARLVVQPRLVAQVALELFLGGEVQRGEPLEDMVDRTLCAMLLTGYATFTLDWLLGGRLCLDHFLPPFLFLKKKQGR